MFFVKHAILLTALFGQIIHCALPEPKYDGFFVDEQPEDGIGGIYPGLGEGMTNADMGNLAIAASTDAVTMAIKRELDIPKGVTVYVSGNRDLVIGAIGAGTGLHGEENVKVFCDGNGLEFEGGRIVTYIHKTGFISSCDHTWTNTHNCVQLLDKHDIGDSYRAVSAAVKAPQRRNTEKGAVVNVTFHA